MTATLPDEPSPAQRLVRARFGGSRCRPVALRIVGFLTQQAAEKALKAGLFAALVAAPRIHGLQQLLDRYPAGDEPAINLDDLDLLDPWVFDGRYAADLPDLTDRDARRLMTAAERVVDAVLANRPELRF